MEIELCSDYAVHEYASCFAESVSNTSVNIILFVCMYKKWVLKVLQSILCYIAIVAKRFFVCLFSLVL